MLERTLRSFVSLEKIHVRQCSKRGYIYIYIHTHTRPSHHRRGQNCQPVEGAKIWGYSRNAISKRGAKNAPSQFRTYYRKNARARARMGRGVEMRRGQGKARAFLPSPSRLSSLPLLVKRHPDIFLLISRFNENFFISPPAPQRLFFSSLSLDPNW